MPPDGASGACSLVGDSSSPLKKSAPVPVPVPPTPGNDVLQGEVSWRGAVAPIGRILVAEILRGAAAVDRGDATGEDRGWGVGEAGAGVVCERGRVRGDIELKADHELVSVDASDNDARLDWMKLQARGEGRGGMLVSLVDRVCAREETARRLTARWR